MRWNYVQGKVKALQMIGHNQLEAIKQIADIL
jgi:hypothetical protein